MNKQTQIFTDEHGISKTVKDMVTFCNILNNTIKTLKEQGLMGEVTEPIAKELAMLNTDTIKASLRKTYEDKAATIEIPFEKLRFMAGLKNVFELTDVIVGKMAETIASEAVHLPLRIKDDPSNINAERLKYIIVRAGMVTYDIDKIKEEFTYTLSTTAESFIKRARALHKQMVEFDRDVRLLSGDTGNLIFGIGEVGDSYCDSLISIGDGIIHLDLRLVKNLNFVKAEKLLNSKKQFDNSMIWEIDK